MYDYHKPSRELLIKPIIKEIPVIKSCRKFPDVDIASIPEIHIEECAREYGKKVEEYLINLFEQFGVKKEDILFRVTARVNRDQFEKDIYIDGWYAFTLKSTTEFDFSSEMKANISIIPYRRNI